MEWLGGFGTEEGYRRARIHLFTENKGARRDFEKEEIFGGLRGMIII